MKNRNNTIDFLKLLFSVIIVIHHISINMKGFNIFCRGLLAVDFFFIVSGYLFYYTALKDQDNNVYISNIKLIIKKYKSFFPYVFIGFVLSLSYRIIIDKIAIHTILNSVYSLLLLQMSGLPMSKINNQTWYLSVMLLVMFIIYPLLKKNKEKYLNYLCPLIIILGAGIFTKVFSNFNDIYSFKYFMYNGFLRGLFEINIGLFLAHISMNVKNIKITKLFKFILGTIEILGYAFVIIMMNSINAKMDLFIVLVLTIAIFISFNKLGYINYILSKINFTKIKNLSLAIYCLHIPIIQWLLYLNKNLHLSNVSIAIMIITITLIVSILTIKITKFISQNIKFQNLLIKNEDNNIESENK